MQVVSVLDLVEYKKGKKLINDRGVKIFTVG